MTIKVYEADHQKVVIEWANLMAKGKYPMLKWLYAIPNEGLHKAQYRKHQAAMGLKPGVPDLCLPYPRLWCGDDPDHGLYIELKSKDTRGKVSPAQQEYIDYLRETGYHVEVCWTADEAIKVIEDYLK